MLIKNGADIFFKDEKGNTALNIAEQNQDQEIIDLILQIGHVNHHIISEEEYINELDKKITELKNIHHFQSGKEITDLIEQLNLNII